MKAQATTNNAITASIATDAATKGKALQLLDGAGKLLVSIPLAKKRADGISAEVDGLSKLLAQAPRAVKKMLAQQAKPSAPAQGLQGKAVAPKVGAKKSGAPKKPAARRAAPKPAAESMSTAGLPA